MNEKILSELLTKMIGSGYNENNEIEFVKTNTQLIETTLINLYENITKKTLSRADPVRLFLLSICYIINMLLNLINYTGKQNLLRYTSGAYLDELGYLMDTERLKATPAKTTLKITLSEILQKDIIISKGVRVTPDSNIFFTIDNDTIIKAGTLEIETSATCTEVGVIGNNFLPGQIKMIVDVQPYVKSMVNITTSEGGSEIEDDASYRKRIHEAPESFSVAGSTGAYEYWAKTASSLIADVKVVSPAPGKVNIYAVLENGKIPQEELLNKILEICSDKKIRPLTDKVSAKAPSVINFDVDITYFIENTNIYNINQIKENVEKAINEWIIWTKSKIGRDINPSELIRKITIAGAKRVEITAPAFTKINSDKDNIQIAIANSPKITFGGYEDE